MSKPLTGAQIERLWVQAGGPAHLAPTMASIALRESGGQYWSDNSRNGPGGTKLNKNGTVDYGLWAINSVHGFNPRKLKADPLYNARAAVKVFKKQGLGAWASSSGAGLPKVPHLSPQQLRQPVSVGGSGSGGGSRSGGNATGTFDAGTSPQGLAALIASATAPQRTAPPVTLRAAPAFAAKAPMPAGYAGIEATSAPPAPKPSVDDQITQAAQLTQLALPQIAKQTGTAGGSGAAGGTVAGGGRRGQVKVAPGANRQGQGLSGELTHFVSLVAGRARQPITITTGTNHDRLTVNGNVSDHYDGHASDIAVPVDSGEGDHIA